ncbi:hypothetical protein [Sphingobacterium sp.]|uniref:hypothetical protein n=1 Tax=Sphingobacterium sp. TaxID=341027 RepID=UPI0028B169F8|nr:hypothetical protein [Sphingobacterium sp.]
MKLTHRNKREELEGFVREQLIGPGSYKFKYHFQFDANEDVSLNDYEIIPEVPAYQYSTAILFPETEEKDGSKEESDEIEGDGLEGNTNTSADSDEMKSDTVESLSSKQQNYPTDFGLSFVIKENANINEDLDVIFSFRRYEKFTKKKYKRVRLLHFNHRK